MAKIKSGSGFIEANRQMEDAAKAGQVAREAGDAAAEAKASERLAAAKDASEEYVAENYPVAE
ncbi:hypothetical protein AB0D37_06885 [Streptomyces sp. NPDC048384]|uniref:hypothetical protein n=1 Tax=Streptomyces sp. NPDC048384 TaxID=3155487 RepID=UPI0034358E1C